MRIGGGESTTEDVVEVIPEKRGVGRPLNRVDEEPAHLFGNYFDHHQTIGDGCYLATNRTPD